VVTLSSSITQKPTPPVGTHGIRRHVDPSQCDFIGTK
jgi:hypothetical protein